jgi:type I restriction-modification system DNA methylase subunit
MKEHYFVPQSAEIVDKIDAIARRHGSRDRVFDDLLTLSVCALAGGRQEGEYLRTARPYCDGKPGERSIDQLVEVFAQIVSLTELTQSDVLGDIFQGAITRGENGQFFTPDSVCALMASMSDTDERRDKPLRADNGDGRLKTIFDPCVGSGRMLLAAAKVNRDRYFVGQDIDHRCAKIAAINLALWNLSGRIIWGNTLTNEIRRVYHTGFDGRGLIRIEDVEISAMVPFVQAAAQPNRSLDDHRLRQFPLFADLPTEAANDEFADSLG